MSADSPRPRVTPSSTSYSSPDFRAADTGSSTARVMGLLQLERQALGAELDLLASMERMPAVDAPAVDQRPVGGSHVRHRPAPLGGANLGVAAGHVGIVDHDVAVAAAAQHEPAAPHHDAPPVQHDQRPLRALVDRLRLVAQVLSAVDHGASGLALLG